jgi:hypothetical protein
MNPDFTTITELTGDELPVEQAKVVGYLAGGEKQWT